MKKIINLFKKFREIIVYLIVGVMTTIVAWGVMFLVNFIFFGNTAHPTPEQNLILSIVNWSAGIAFAYPTNRVFVFRSKDSHIFTELIKFIASRISTLILDIVVRQILGFMGVDVYVGTLISAVLVVIGNYVFSKLMVFSKKKS